MLGYCDQSLLQANFLKKFPNAGKRFSAETGRKDLCPVGRLRGKMQRPVCARQAGRSIRKDPVCARKAGANRVVFWFQGPIWLDDRRVKVVVSAYLQSRPHADAVYTGGRLISRKSECPGAPCSMPSSPFSYSPEPLRCSRSRSRARTAGRRTCLLPRRQPLDPRLWENLLTCYHLSPKPSCSSASMPRSGSGIAMEIRRRVSGAGLRGALLGPGGLAVVRLQPVLRPAPVQHAIHQLAP